jgi:cysteine desulfurase
MWEGLALLVLLVLLLIWYSGRALPAPTPYYFDNNGTTPLCRAAKAAWEAALSLGNASAAYASRARAIIEDAERQVQEWIGAPWKVVFTSGGSESNNLVLRGLPITHLLLGATEHTTSLECAKQLTDCDVQYVAAEIDGGIAPARLATSLNAFDMPTNGIEMNARVAAKPSPHGGIAGLTLVSVMHANNETGALNDLAALLKVCRRYGALLHTDAVQTFGKFGGLAAHCDLLSASFHKLGGPLGVGLLAMRPEVAARLAPQICGPQQCGLRGGTLNTPGIAAAAAALRVARADRAGKNAAQGKLRAQLVAGLRERFPFVDFSHYAGRTDEETRKLVLQNQNPVHIVPITLIGKADGAGKADATDESLPGTFLFSIVKNRDPHFCNIRLRDRLQEQGVAVSIGSACSTGKKGPSHVLTAIQAPFLVRCGVVRVSFGDGNTSSEVCYLLEMLDKFIAEQM